LVLAAISAGALIPAASAFAADRVTIIVAGMEKQIYLPAKLAERLGFFEDAGLDVKLVNAETGIEAQNELLTGAAQAAVGFYDHTIALQARGNYVVALVQFGQAPGEVELVSERYAKQINTPADLRGHHLGVAGLGSSTDFLTRYIGYLNGLKFGDYKLVPIEAGDSFINAMRQGGIAAGMTTEPTAGRLLKSGGAKILVDLRTPESTHAAFGGCYPGAAFYVQSDWLAMHREVAERLVMAFVKTMRYMAAHSASEIADKLPDQYFEGDKAFYIDRLTEGKTMFTVDGRMPDGCPEGALKTLSAFSKALQDKPIDLAKTYTNSLVDDAIRTLEQSKDGANWAEPADRRGLQVDGP
jgi:NitT/TauT family transport system substrate-binding protein